MYATTIFQERARLSPVSHTGKMGISSITHVEPLQERRPSEDIHASTPYMSYTHPQTPPDSISGSPRLKLEGSFTHSTRDCSPLPRLTRLDSTASASSIRLPSLEEFDQGVEALARSYGPPARPWTPPSPLAGFSRGTLHHQPLPPLHYVTQDRYHGYSMADSYSSMDGYPSPPPDAENRHINQKYTTEEGDFIIYAWHDKKLKWQRIKQDFASMFGRTPERTVQGLQAWYYRMNQRIPLWDQEGWLIFDNDDDLEPRQISIKCRERDSQDKPMEPLGLAQRYPERAMHYSWVDSDMKRKCRDWASKRSMQYRERKERRKRKEQRRMKL